MRKTQSSGTRPVYQTVAETFEVKGAGRTRQSGGGEPRPQGGAGAGAGAAGSEGGPIKARLGKGLPWIGEHANIADN